MKKKSTHAKTYREVRDWEIVKDELKAYLDANPRSKFEIIEKAGLSKDAYYKLFSENRKKSPMRRATVEGLAKALNLSCMYPHGGIPSFDAEEPLTESLKQANTKDAIKYAIDIVGSIELLSEKTDIPVDYLQNWAESDNPEMSISIEALHKIANSINRTLIVFGDNAISLVDTLGGDPEMQPSIVRIDLSTLAPVNSYYTPQILDRGLQELISYENRKKHEITDQEIKALSHIQDSRETDGTISQWINILYAIRGLNSI